MWNPFNKGFKEAKLPYETEIHCHILPGVDDGSPDLEHSVELVRRMRALGLKRIVASPHVLEEYYENTPEILDPALASLNDALAELTAEEEGGPFIVERSGEYRVDNFFRQQLEAGNVVPLPGNYLLIENPLNHFSDEPYGLDQFLYELSMKGYRLILAHPERYFYYHNRLSRYDQLHQMGVDFQLNILSLAGYYGEQEQKIAFKLIEKGYCDYLGSDIHNRHHVDAIERYLRSSAYRKLLPSLRLKNDRMDI